MNYIVKVNKEPLKLQPIKITWKNHCGVVLHMILDHCGLIHHMIQFVILRILLHHISLKKQYAQTRPESDECMK